MDKFIDIIIGLGINIFILILFVFKMLVTSDVPVSMSLKECTFICILLISILLIYNFYINRTKFLLINIIFILFPLFLWFTSMKQALIYNYHKYDTLTCIIGFSIILILLLKIIYIKIKRIKIAK